ncbi:cytochrome o ubiquinol oxidase subunit III [Desulfobacter vibrioformis]|uniref:cytochrome o ubiquinol oxidase subunit III n=1 Tax=Desulfobacter vibrioformis TaxID=34031 RepID=UPI00055135E7|nr:cytochrome o ubiquinol oxidase subunit III [Desulfobacter vibrioformis]
MKHEAVSTHSPEHLKKVEINALGFWIYLMSDLVIFSILFTTFVVLGHNYAGSAGPGELFSLPYLFVETLLLLISSVVYGTGMVALQDNKSKTVLKALGITFLLGAGFVLMEIYEFYDLIAAGHTPRQSGFLSAFFTIVGTHGAHVSFGLLWMLIMMYQVKTRGLTLGVCSRLMQLSLFWHFLDIVWVGVFTVVYLAGVV